ncbi:uncharacterized protein LOC131950313 [Physella acuta]|uniref:uncharacterized protein LOC131950313 n=1 Tax=Physella acuta TaxID=109671 RepID=UPI0027DE3B2D|nr:uncharacterized protein LOC131950313 [Physella acuta]
MPRLGLSLNFCQRCGPGGLDDFCVKRYDKCLSRVASTAYNTVPDAPPPHGYRSSGPFPASCIKLVNVTNSIPNRAGITGTTPIYLQTRDWGNSLPRVYFNPAVVPFLNIVLPLHQCLANNAPFPNGRWNWNNPYNIRYGYRTDSFYYIDDSGNYVWSYQCYCDYCNSCQSCTNG